MKVHSSAHNHVREHAPSQSHKLRVSIQSGGCNGFIKQFTWCDQIHADDHILQDVVIVDDVSYHMLSEAELHYVTSLHAQGFQLVISDAQSECGCGKSFLF
jgi:iron-sulfur cluster assembly accessory protein